MAQKPRKRYPKGPPKRFCSYPGCDLPHSAHGYCPAHLHRSQHGLPMDAPINRRNRPLQDRLLEHIEFDTNGGCWLWSDLQLDHDGYGILSVRHKPRKAPVWAWMAWRGPIPAGLCVLHTCDVRACINPDHLWLGTQYENDMDRVRKGRTSRIYNEANAATRISSAAIAEMRERWNAGASQASIARAFGCSPGHVSVIVRRLARP
jgi:hypothetical protein